VAIFFLSKCSGGKYHPQERRLSIVEKVVDIAEELTARTDVGQMSQSPSQRLQFFDNSAVVQIIPVVIYSGKLIHSGNVVLTLYSLLCR